MDVLLTRMTNLEQRPQQVQPPHNDERHLAPAGRVDPRCQRIQQPNEELGNINLEIPNFSDLFPKEMPKGLPPLRGIEHQIDFVPGSTLPNRPAYKTNPVEAKEIQKQVEELLEIGHIRENLSLCAIPVLIVPKKDGFHVSIEGVTMDSKKVEAITSWPTPTNVSNLRSFLGLAGFYRKFEQVFATLKEKLTAAPVLVLPCFDKTFELECDASGIGIGAILMQDKRPIAYFSEKLGGAPLNYPTYDNELYFGNIIYGLKTLFYTLIMKP
ncbi:PREDICTED: uncharacterized protein LOC109156534 [Ipomoea nil]|uniref:uncharacterized protein LOC109156534 n=1 Tax=Ipomoea nil TaxID=35883 RepID=UPI000900BF70|nr:PREDICTED: uncharacterized protein LOC109156534 [Ipomoea nil]